MVPIQVVRKMLQFSVKFKKFVIGTNIACIIANLTLFEQLIDYSNFNSLKNSTLSTFVFFKKVKLFLILFEYISYNFTLIKVNLRNHIHIYL